MRAIPLPRLSDDGPFALALPREVSGRLNKDQCSRLGSEAVAHRRM